MRIISESSNKTKPTANTIIDDLTKKASSFRDGIVEAMKEHDFESGYQEAKHAREYFEEKKKEFKKDYKNLKSMQKEVKKILGKASISQINRYASNQRRIEKLNDGYTKANASGMARVRQLSAEHEKRDNNTHEKNLRRIHAATRMTDDILTHNDAIMNRELKKIRKTETTKNIKFMGYSAAYIGLIANASKIPNAIDAFIEEFSEFEMTCKNELTKEKIRENKKEKEEN